MIMDDLLKKLNAAGLEVKDDVSTSQQTYTPCHCKILKASFEKIGDSKVNHYMLKNRNADGTIRSQGMEGRVMLTLWMEVTPKGSTLRKHIEVGKCLTSKFEPATYGTFTASDGNVVPGTLLHDVIHAVKETNPEQAHVFDPGWLLNPTTFKDLEFDFECKIINTKDGEEALILKTSYKEYQDEQRGQNKEQTENSPAINTVVEEEDMPF